MLNFVIYVQADTFGEMVECVAVLSVVYMHSHVVHGIHVVLLIVYDFVNQWALATYYPVLVYCVGQYI